MKLSAIHNEIDNLIEKVDQFYRTPIAKSQAEVDRWYADPKAYYLEKMKCISPLSDHLMTEVTRVAGIWTDYQGKKFSAININSLEELKAKMDDINHCIDDNGDWVYALRKSRLFSECDIRNISHIELFVIKLPSAMPGDCDEFMRIGLAMAGLFLIEKLGRYSFESKDASSMNPYKKVFGLDNVKALYDIACDSVVWQRTLAS